LVIPESCFPYSGVWIGGIKDDVNYYHYRSQISATLDDIFLRSYIENDDMTDTRREFNLVFCLNVCVKLSRIGRTRRAEMRRVKMIAQPDLMRHYVFMDIRASDVALSNFNYSERIPAEFIPVITKYCGTCMKHFT
jgi:hypothetical protein